MFHEGALPVVVVLCHHQSKPCLIASSSVDRRPSRSASGETRALHATELFAEIDLLGALSAYPGGDCSATHSSDAARCWPLKVEVLRARAGALEGWTKGEASGYSPGHGVG